MLNNFSQKWWKKNKIKKSEVKSPSEEHSNNKIDFIVKNRNKDKDKNSN